MNPENPHRQNFPALDGVRGVAILLVIIYHNFGLTDQYFAIGYLGVDLFFVLSGFLITDILLKELGSKNFLRNFYARRILRIFPLYYLCLILFLIVLPRLNTGLNLKYYTYNQIWLWTYQQNWLYIFKPTDSTNVLHHFWSLAVEEQFYLLWPLAMLLLRKPKYQLIFISSLLVAVMGFRFWVWLKPIAGFDFYNFYTFTRIDGICIGCIIALLLRINKDFIKKYTRLIILFLSVICSLVFLVNRQYQYSFPYLWFVGYTTIAILFGLLVNQIVTKANNLLNTIFSFPLLIFFGKISYCFYIFHWPIYLFLRPYLSLWIEKFSSGWPAQFIVSFLATLPAIVVSWLSYKYFESYFLRLKRKFVT